MMFEQTILGNINYSEFLDIANLLFGNDIGFTNPLLEKVESSG